MALTARILKQKKLDAIGSRMPPAGLVGRGAVIEIGGSHQFSEHFFKQIAKSDDERTLFAITPLVYNPLYEGSSYVQVTVRGSDEPLELIAEFCRRIVSVGENPGLILDLPPLVPRRRM